jgi:hypothetical protein
MQPTDESVSSLAEFFGLILSITQLSRFLLTEQAFFEMAVLTLIPNGSHPTKVHMNP